jgi:hypothetical protein
MRDRQQAEADMGLFKEAAIPENYRPRGSMPLLYQGDLKSK